MIKLSQKSLYDPRHEHDSCGTGFVVQIDNTPSHRILEMGLEAVINLTHRGAVSSDGKTGDGAGITTQIPREFFQREVRLAGDAIDNPEDLGVGMIFFPQDPELRERCRAILENQILRNNFNLIAWRKVPTHPDALGEQARSTMPVIEQVLIRRGEHIPKKDFEKALYVVRKGAEKRIREESIRDFYIVSMSCRTLIYKGLLVASQLKNFYPPLDASPRARIR